MKTFIICFEAGFPLSLEAHHYISYSYTVGLVQM